MAEKILYIASTAEHLRQFHLPYLRALRERGYIVTAAGAGEGFGLPEGVGFLPVPFEKRYLSRQNLRSVRLMATELRRERYDLVLLHTTLAAFFTRLALYLAGKGEKRVVNTVHGYLFDDESPALKRFALLTAERLCAPVTDEILVMNQQDLRIARRRRLCRGSAALIPGMGVDFAAFVPPTTEERRAARRRFDLPENALVLLCAAEFSVRKNQRFLLQALPKLPEKVYLLLPGEGALRRECQELAASLGAAARVRFPGRIADIAAACHAADLCVSASRSEGLPFAVMEAMSCGLPAVLSAVKGHEDLLRAEDAGRLYPFGDEGAFCRCVTELLSDDALRAHMGQAARKAVEPYGIERVLPQVLSHYVLDK